MSDGNETERMNKPPNSEKKDETGGEVKADFKYIVRIANTDLDGHRLTVNALTSIKGIGDRIARVIVNKVGISPTEKIGDLSDGEIEKLAECVASISENIQPWLLNRQRDYHSGEDLHITGNDLIMRRQEDVNLLRKIRCYRGIRHERGQKVRGQRTKSNGRTQLTVGVVKKAQKPGQAK